MGSEGGSDYPNRGEGVSHEATEDGGLVLSSTAP